MIGKAIAWNLKPDFKDAMGPKQVGAGHQARAESAIHVMCSICQEKNNDEVLLIDAFTSLN